jgi:acetyl-CoA/propionyl-CoA carboxylase biotin carboxyl carrier protein
MEFRINAEDATDDFAPAQGGSLETYDPPGGIGVRLDDALRQGDDLVTDYDSMIAKLIVHGADREECIARSKRALREYDIDGIVTIIPFHLAMLDDPQFAGGLHTTKYLDNQIDRSVFDEYQAEYGSTTSTADDDEETVTREFTIEVNGKRFDVDLEESGVPMQPAPSKPSPPSGGSGGGGGSDDGGSDAASVSAEGEVVSAEMQGTVIGVNVAVGDEVEAGDVLLVLEAMKMENDIVAEFGGTVAEVAVEEGQSVDQGDALVVLD